MEILPDAMDDALTETLRHATKRKMDRLKKALKLPKLPIGAKRKSINASKITESVFYGKVEDVKKLAQEYAHEKETFNRIALHCACQHGKVAVVRFLVENKADLNACDDYNRSALMKAVEHQRESCVRILLGSGADINHVDSDGRTALHLAVAKKSMRIVELLIKKKADIHAKDKNGHTPLVLAVLDGQYEVVKYLIEKGADVDVRDQQLRTPLMLAVVGGCQKTWQLLLDSGADRTLKDISGQTADDYIADLPKFLSVKKPASQESSNTSTRSSKRNTESKKRSTKNKECDNSCEVQEGLFGGLASDSDELTTREVMKDMEKKKELKSFKWTNPDSDHCSSDIMEFKPVPHQQKLPEEMLEIDLGSDEKSVVESEPQEPDSSSLEEDEFTLKCPEGLQSLVPQKNISQDPINKMKQPNLSPDVEASIQKKKSSPPPLQTKFQPKVRSTKVPLKQEEDKPRSGTKMDQTREDQRKVDKNQQSKIQIPKVSEKEKMLQQIALQKDQLEALKAELESSQANSLLKEQGLMEEIEALKQQMAVSSQKKKMRLQEIALQKDQLEALKAELESSQANSLLKEQGLVEEIEALKQQMAMSSQKKKMRLQQIALQKDQLEALKAELESSQANSLLKEQGLMEEIEALKQQIAKLSDREKMLQINSLEKDQLEALKAELDILQVTSLLKEQGLMEEIEALKQQIAEPSDREKKLLQRNTSLQQRVTSLEIKLKDSKRSRGLKENQLMEENEALKKQIAKLSDREKMLQINSLEKDQLEALKAELDILQVTSLLTEQGLMEEIEALKQQIAEPSDREKKLLQRNTSLQQRVTSLEIKLKDSKRSRGLKENQLMEENEALKKQIAKPSDREKMLQKNSLEKDQLEALKAELDSLQVNSFLTEQGLMEAIEALKQQIAEPSDREKKLLQRNTSLQQQVTSLEIKLKDSKSSRGLKENQLVEENEALKKQLETVAAELTQEQKTRHLLETEVKSSQTCLSEVIQEAERSKAAQEDREKSLLKEMDEHKQLTAEAASLRESVRSLSQQLISAEERATSLEKEIHHLTQQLSEKDLLLDTLQQDKDQAAASVKELEKAQRELVSAPKEAVNKLLTQAQREYQLLWQHLEIAQEKIDELQRNLKKKTSQCSHLQEENKLLEDELASLKNKSNRIEQLENKVRNLEDELASPKNMSHRIEQLENKLSKLEDELLVLRSQAEAANREKDQMTQYCSDLKEKARKTIQKKEDQISLLKSQAAARQSPNPQNTMYLQLSKKNRELEGGSASPKNVSFRKEQLEKKLSKLEVELLVLKSQAEAANREKDQMTQYCRDLKEKIWKTIQKKEDQINLLKSQAAAQQSLNPQNPVHLQLSKNTELEDATFNGYTTYEELLKQRDSARAEVAQVKEVYSQEMQVRLAAANQIDSLGLQLGELAHEVQRMVAAGTSNMKKS
ncbi:ankyrin repeat domain-containing protein 62-like isoform X3 [Thalassophryne amazonica]|uniref:ankyrin repeat domain-containing protein 62-like isoform X3 n=1 Tax=Thalassophryne amazonica TaxID=390379 RepID=UPI001471213D|nr:ankyrin repeat domain-containing protein 62-like isoform X3 [Thalassophryne amazonica]